MYLGTLVEMGPSDKVFFEPQHPYTKLLIESNPEPDPELERKRQFVPIQGEITSPVNVGAGCRFADRCPSMSEQCQRETPPLTQIASDHMVSCHLFG